MNVPQTEDAAIKEAWRALTNKKFLEWQNQLGVRKTVTEFAEYIGFPQSTVSFWLNGSRFPKSSEEIEKLSSIWGLTVYDTLKIERRMNISIFSKRFGVTFLPKIARARHLALQQDITAAQQTLATLPAYIRQAPPTRVNATLHKLFQKITITKDHKVDVEFRK